MRGLLEAGIVHMAKAPMRALDPAERRLVLVAEALAVGANLIFVDEGYEASVGKLVLPGRTLVVVMGNDGGTRIDRSLRVDADGSVRVFERSAVEAA